MVGAQALRVACGLSNQRDRDGDKAAIEFSDEINFLVPVDSKSRPIPQPTFTAPASCLVVMNWGTEHRRQSQVHMCSKPSMFGGCGGWERERLTGAENAAVKKKRGRPSLSSQNKLPGPAPPFCSLAPLTRIRASGCTPISTLMASAA
eukprot:1031575-Rhodomonas_salina.2